MAQSNPQIPWTDEQWARVNQVIQEEAHRARIAATFLPLYGPLPANADFVRTESISYKPLKIADKNTTQLATLQLNVRVRGEQLADPEMGSVLALFRRAANVIARLEDAPPMPDATCSGVNEPSAFWRSNDSVAINGSQSSVSRPQPLSNRHVGAG